MIITCAEDVAFSVKCDPQTGSVLSIRAVNPKFEDGPVVLSVENRIHMKFPAVVKGLDMLCDPHNLPISGSAGPFPSRIYQ